MYNLLVRSIYHTYNINNLFTQAIFISFNAILIGPVIII